ncbi:hypothetical protein OsI_33681 [Oryza sativa Indica Group]|uniref:BTB domain-containing protein n=1 Tax=Oryza sativa subsp. indica TaxID=39946 RepID=A2Z7K0_ORYSI|nr:hypothetical protein OsI_33681 [Oryza sativa Indica Group]
MLQLYTLQTLVASSTSNHGSVRHVSRTLWHHRRQRRWAADAVVVEIRLHHRRRHGQRVPPPQDRRLLAHQGSLPHQHCPQVPRFHHRGHRWRIQYYPNGNTPNCGDYISLFLHLDEEVTREVYAQLQFRLLDDELGDKLPPPPPPPSLDANKFFSHASWGLPKFIKKEELEKSRHLKGNSFTVRCDVVVITEFVAKDMPEAATATAARRRTPARGTGSFVSVAPSDLHRHLGELLLGEKGADVVFKVGGKTFTAHRCVLAARSPVFGAELLGSMKESRRKAVVRVDDMEAQVFKALLRFAYTDSLPEMKEKDEGAMCQHLLVAADRYAMERLKLVCEEKLCERIDVSSVATVLALAEQHHCDGLRNACFDFLSSPENLKAAMAGDGFEHLSRSCPSLMTELVAMLGNLVQ